MHTPYLVLGLLCGLAIGYTFGRMEHRKKRQLVEGQARRTALLDAREAVDSNHCDGESQWARGINDARRTSLLRIDRLIAQGVDCDGGSPCTTCPDSEACQRGCIRQHEFIDAARASQKEKRNENNQNLDIDLC